MKGRAELIIPVDQPVIWIFQPPRSGGTLLLRLFDGHRQLLVHPAPMSFRWPNKIDIEALKERFSLAKFNERGFAKTASNRGQPPIPIDFDECMRRDILERAIIRTPRELFNTGNTAYFNAWLNCQNRDGDKRYVLLHSTLWSHTPGERSTKRFFKAYPDGWTVFVARPPADWLASGLKLKGSKLSDMEFAVAEYCAAYETYLKTRSWGGTRSIALEFNELVTAPQTTLSAFCTRIGIDYDLTLETTTVNGVPIGPNSSHDGETKHAPDPSLIGHGAEIMEQARRLKRYAEAERLFEKVCEIRLATSV